MADIIDLVEVIRAKRDGEALPSTHIAALVESMNDPAGITDAQLAAFAMAVLLRGMDARECAALTQAMTRSGTVMDWDREQLPGPCVDKHSTGGVGDKVSLLLAPMLAACGAYVPMVSGRGLGHSGGTLDKLEAIPGYRASRTLDDLKRVVRQCGCAIVGATGELAPADARLYAIRDVTATVESAPLVTASILSKKLAAGVGALVMDVKCGNGAFNADLEAAKTVATSLTSVAAEAGLPMSAIITDMNQVLGTTAGNALEVHEVVAALRGDQAMDARLNEVVTTLGAEALQLSGLAGDAAEGIAMLTEALTSGAAAERFERMVAALGGSADVVSNAAAVLPDAPVVLEVRAPESGYVASMDTRALGLLVVHLGGGRRRPDDVVDPSVGLSDIIGLGAQVAAGDVLMRIHAASEDAAEAASETVLASLQLASTAPAATPVILKGAGTDT